MTSGQKTLATLLRALRIEVDALTELNHDGGEFEPEITRLGQRFAELDDRLAAVDTVGDLVEVLQQVDHRLPGPGAAV